MGEPCPAPPGSSRAVAICDTRVTSWSSPLIATDEGDGTAIAHSDVGSAVPPVDRAGIEIDGTGLTVDEICAVADRRAALTLTRTAVARADRSRDFANATAARRPLYGRSTG